MSSRATKGREIVQQTFGGSLYQQGRGYYSAMELLAILRGEVLLEEREGGETNRVLPEEGTAVYLRPSHDHARRLLVGGAEEVNGVFDNADTRAAVRALLRGIEAPVPGRRRVPDKWQQRHFYPYPTEAIHYDAVERRGKVSVERYQFRGAGGLAHKMLRSDPNRVRLGQTRQKFRELLGKSDSSVGSLLNALSEHDSEPAAEVFEDKVEAQSLEFSSETGTDAETRWVAVLREGVHRILHRSGLSNYDRVDGLMHWVPWCVAMHQLSRARRVLGNEEDTPLVYDAGYTGSPVRSLARRDLRGATAAIKASLHSSARDAGAPELTRGSAAWWRGPRSFFTTTMFAIGALNANTGRRHFELRPQLAQAIVHALVDEPVSLDRFSREFLGQRLRIIVDRHSEAVFGPVGIDGRHLQTNGEHFERRLDEVGLLRAFSDSTLMVGSYA